MTSSIGSSSGSSATAGPVSSGISGAPSSGISNASASDASSSPGRIVSSSLPGMTVTDSESFSGSASALTVSSETSSPKSGKSSAGRTTVVAFSPRFLETNNIKNTSSSRPPTAPAIIIRLAFAFSSSPIKPNKSPNPPLSASVTSTKISSSMASSDPKASVSSSTRSSLASSSTSSSSATVSVPASSALSCSTAAIIICSCMAASSSSLSTIRRFRSSMIPSV